MAHMDDAILQTKTREKVAGTISERDDEVRFDQPHFIKQHFAANLMESGIDQRALNVKLHRIGDPYIIARCDAAPDQFPQDSVMPTRVAQALAVDAEKGADGHARFIAASQRVLRAEHDGPPGLPIGRQHARKIVARNLLLEAGRDFRPIGRARQNRHHPAFGVPFVKLLTKPV